MRPYGLLTARNLDSDNWRKRARQISRRPPPIRIRHQGRLQYSSGSQLDMKAFSGDTCFVAAAPLSSDVAGTAAFSPLVPSQRRVSRHGISEGRHVTIIDEEERPATRDPTTVMPVPQAREMLVEGSMKR
ncbi:hypothetical protein GJ744_005229 [Endocarpon pusillum]|uniref:Uncharacterized protein n=1 Tax=Endocarpon pusillum TaxID=364733 RepID=A0A8H7E183_9EURO|nr:hypothetical protein GJ744_005229 [Endocarpon pusillum]